MMNIEITLKADGVDELTEALARLAAAIETKPAAQTAPKLEIATARGEVSGAEIIVPAPGQYIVTEAGHG